ncbi:MAG TPA: SRPBCC family protein [Candidatus Hydrogenedentes bacterium]|nr:SRPBCC family protein [Candidatus Hydrogenedentota bacterium]HRK34543.1 SRPBCC family protein [Candidatus Hydrogenedentota bacterium]
MNDRIVKQIELKAPVSRVWEALTDYRQFGEWFRAKIDEPFVVGAASTGHMTYPGYEHLKWEAVVQKMEPERYFAFTWSHPSEDPNDDNTNAPCTLVEFTLEPTPNGTKLTVTESGFENIPADRRDKAFRDNDGGWSIQTENIRVFLENAA